MENWERKKDHWYQERWNKIIKLNDSPNITFNSPLDSYKLIGHKKMSSYSSECAADTFTEADTGAQLAQMF